MEGGGERGLCVQRSQGSISCSLHSLPSSPLHKAISILKAVRSPSVLRTVSYLTQSFLPSLIQALRELVQPQERHGTPWLTRGALWPRASPSSPLQGICTSLWPLCFQLPWSLKQGGPIREAACSCCSPGWALVGLA